jgi:hypothetical protein
MIHYSRERAGFGEFPSAFRDLALSVTRARDGSITTSIRLPDLTRCPFPFCETLFTNAGETRKF